MAKKSRRRVRQTMLLASAMFAGALLGGAFRSPGHCQCWKDGYAAGKADGDSGLRSKLRDLLEEDDDAD